MSRRLFYCTNCNITLAVRARRQLPKRCPTCKSHSPGKDAIRGNLFDEVGR